MDLIRGVHNLREQQQGCVATIGVYDGVHVGHQQIIRQVCETARAKSLPSVVVTFEPTPQEYFFPQNPPARLMRFGEKFEALEDYGIDLFYCPHFDDEMRNIKPEVFIQKILIELLNVRHMVIGDDFHFARNRSGSMEDLVSASAAHEFDVWHIPSIDYDGERVSSTAVRRALAAGDLERASALLGKRYRMSGKVVEGNHLGRRLGFPTANVNPDRRQVALMGIYAARVHGLGDQALDGVAALGTRPTVDGTKPLLEAHIFDFDEDIYGEHIQVEFIVVSA